MDTKKPIITNIATILIIFYIVGSAIYILYDIVKDEPNLWCFEDKVEANSDAQGLINVLRSTNYQQQIELDSCKQSNINKNILYISILISISLLIWKTYDTVYSKNGNPNTMDRNRKKV